MKRIVSLALIGVILVFSLAPEAAAASDYQSNQFINILEYSSVGTAGDNSFGFTNETTVRYDFPDAYIGYVDMIISFSGPAPTTIKIGRPGAYNSLTILKLNNQCYRVYGAAPSLVYTYFNITFTSGNTSERTNLTIHSLKASRGQFAVYPDVGFLSAGTSGWNSPYVYMADSNSPAIVYLNGVGTNPGQSNFVSYVYSYGWNKYDSLVFYLTCQVNAITSITVNHNDSYVPFELSYFDISTQDWWIADPEDLNWQSVQNDDDVINIMISLDLHNIDRSVSSVPQISIRGQYTENTVESYIRLDSVVGNVDQFSTDPFNYWIRRIHASLETIDVTLSAGFQDLLAALSPDTSPADQFKDDSSELVTGLDDISASMNSVQRPSMDTIDADFSGDYADAGVLLTSIFNEVNSVSWLSRIIFISVTLCLISYILYGKE